jgi:ABC-type phosphate/phosphonate transport system substrate-binding protein
MPPWLDLSKPGNSAQQIFELSGKSPPMPESPVAVRKDLPQAFKRKLQQVLMAMASEAPDAYTNMTAKIYFERYRITKWVPASDATYDSVRKPIREAKTLDFLEQ